MPCHHRPWGRGPAGCRLIQARCHGLEGSSQAKAGADPPPQGALILETCKRLDTFPGRIQQHQRGVANFMAGGKRPPLRGTQVCQDKYHLAAELRPERVDDAPELSTVRSAR
jgi:hypothetical protein